jgi:hypothetical protein
MLTENRRRRLGDVRALVTILARNGLIRDGLTVDVAADALFAIASEDVYLLLVEQCEWSDAQVRAWLADTIERLILR